MKHTFKKSEEVLLDGPLRLMWSQMNKRIAVLGMGHVGLPLSIVLAKAGHKVTAIDINKNAVENINRGSLPIKEKDIQRLFHDAKVKQNLKASEKPSSADVFIVCVQTPVDHTTKKPDLSYVVSATESIIPYLRKDNLIIVESTLPPFTIRKVIRPLVEKGAKMKVGEDVFLAYCPERAMPGRAIYELIHDNRIIGGADSKSAELAKQIYASFVKGEIDLTDDITAEIVKLMENTYRDVNIALANEFSLLAETLGIDIRIPIKLANKHPRVKISNPGIGVGGQCLPKDPYFLIHADPKNTSLILTARKVNELMPVNVAAKIRKFLKNVKDPKIVALGMTYKPDSDDLRGSPSLEVIRILKEYGCNVTAYDNFVNDHGYSSISDIARNADCLVVLVEHTSIKKELDKFENKVKSVMRTPLILRIGTNDGAGQARHSRSKTRSVSR